MFSTVGDDYGAIYRCLLQVMEDTMWSSSSPECGSAEDCYTDEVDVSKLSKPTGNRSKSSNCKGIAELSISLVESYVYYVGVKPAS